MVFLAPLQAFMAYPSSLNSLAPGYSPWDDTSMLIHSLSDGIMLSQDEYNPHGVEGMRIPDFAEVYRFMGSVFDLDTQGHVQKLKEIDPINFETALLLMRNLTINLSSPDFEPIREIKILLEPLNRLKQVDACLNMTQGVLEGVVGEELGVLPGMDSIFPALALQRLVGFFGNQSKYFQNLAENANHGRLALTDDIEVAFNANTTQNYVGSRSFIQETQITSSVLGNLLDVVKEVQVACVELQNLTYSSSCPPSVEQLELHLHFIDFSSGRKVALILDMSCLK
ncbi:unnamed protein product [Camellia sinensis]